MIDKLRDLFLLILLVVAVSGCNTLNTQRATGDLGVVIERAIGRVAIVETTDSTKLASIDGLGDLSHASIVKLTQARPTSGSGGRTGTDEEGQGPC